MEYWRREHNKPISIAMKGYMDKKSGKVDESRKEIKRRFDGLDWRYQKQILFSFLQSCATDRDWAYRKLYSSWDDCFIPTLQELWEKYHETPLSWLIIQFFPIDFVKKHIDELDEGRNYFFLYKRMGDNKDFVLDPTRLNEADLLHVRNMRGLVKTEKDAEDIFFLLIYRLSRGAYDFKKRHVVTYQGKYPIISIFDNRIVEGMMHGIERLYHLDFYELEKDLQAWVGMVSENNLNENKEDENIGYLSAKEEKVVYERIARKMKDICHRYIPEEYTTVWDSFDISDMKSFLNDIEKRHEKNMNSHIENMNAHIENMNSHIENMSKHFVEDKELDNAPF